MERYFPVVSRASSSRIGSDKKDKQRADLKYRPYPLRNEANVGQDKFSQFRKEIEQSDTKVSSSTLTKFVLGTLLDESNPITHSDLRERSDHVVSISTGHQVDDRQLDRGLYLKDRESKLSVQREVASKATEAQVMRNVCVYINGFLENTTDIEMKKVVRRAGGRIVLTPSGCTHVITSMQLSGSKTHKLLTTKSRNRIYVVKPEWVFDSIKAEKRLPEREYAILKNTTMKTLHEVMQKKESGGPSNEERENVSATL